MVHDYGKGVKVRLIPNPSFVDNTVGISFDGAIRYSGTDVVLVLGNGNFGYGLFDLFEYAQKQNLQIDGVKLREKLEKAINPGEKSGWLSPSSNSIYLRKLAVVIPKDGLPLDLDNALDYLMYLISMTYDIVSKDLNGEPHQLIVTYNEQTIDSKEASAAKRKLKLNTFLQSIAEEPYELSLFVRMTNPTIPYSKTTTVDTMLTKAMGVVDKRYNEMYPLIENKEKYEASKLIIAGMDHGAVTISNYRFSVQNKIYASWDLLVEAVMTGKLIDSKKESLSDEEKSLIKLYNVLNNSFKAMKTL